MAGHEEAAATAAEPVFDTANIIYGYVPSKTLAILGCLSFALIALATFSLAVRHRGTRTFQLALTAGCVMETVGYAFRIKSHYDPYSTGLYVAQYVLIVVAPILFSAALYSSLSTAIKRTPGALSLLPFRPKVFLGVFTSMEILTTTLQVVGAALVGAAESHTSQPILSTSRANHILLAGLAVQSAAFLVFLIILSRVFHASRKARSQFPRPSGRVSLIFLTVLMASSLLIFLRTNFRLAETGQGARGSASTNEVLFGVLEFAPVVLALLLWVIAPLAEHVPDEVRMERELEREMSMSLSLGTTSMREAPTMEEGARP